MIEQNGLSRRSFLAGAGIVTGAAVVAAGTSLIKPQSAEAAYTAFPWRYPATGLDLATVKRRGYEYYGTHGGCMSGTAKALVTALIDSYGAGSEWDSIPQNLFRYGAGGVGGSTKWGTICGSLHGAAWVIAACARSGAEATNLIDALYSWYCGFAFPSTDHDSYSPYPGQNTTVCNSPLCHVSVSSWLGAHPGVKVHDAPRGNRCAKVAGDVAGKAAELLNTLFAGGSIPAFVQPDTSCSGCHVTGGSQKWVQMKSSCTPCHTAEKNPCTKP